MCSSQCKSPYTKLHEYINSWPKKVNRNNFVNQIIQNIEK